MCFSHKQSVSVIQLSLRKEAGLERELVRVKLGRLEGGRLDWAILKSKKTDIGNACTATFYFYSLDVSLESKKEATSW